MIKEVIKEVPKVPKMPKVPKVLVCYARTFDVQSTSYKKTGVIYRFPESRVKNKGLKESLKSVFCVHLFKRKLK